ALGQEPSREDGADRSQPEDAEEGQAEGEASGFVRSGPRHKRVLQRLEREQDETEGEPSEDERGRTEERRQEGEQDRRGQAERGQDPIGPSPVGQGARDDLPHGPEAEGDREQAAPEELREGANHGRFVLKARDARETAIPPALSIRSLVGGRRSARNPNGTLLNPKQA